MKKEIFAIILLTAMLAFSIYNIHLINSLTGELIDYVQKAEENADSDNWEKSAYFAEKALDCWRRKHEYTHIVLKHDKIDITTEGIYHLLQTIYAQDKTAAKVTAQELCEALADMSESEQLRIGSIL